MITYLLIGVIFTFIFDMILKGTDNEFVNWERIVMLLLWPLTMAWFVWFMIRNFRGRE